MTIRTAFGKQLLATTALTALVGRRIYPGALKQGEEMPAITWSMIDNPPAEHTGGADTTPERPRFQVSCWGNYDEADAVAAAVKTALKDWGGTMGGAGGVSVGRVMYEDEGDLYDETLQRCGVRLDFIIYLN